LKYNKAYGATRMFHCGTNRGGHLAVPVSSSCIRREYTGDCKIVFTMKLRYRHILKPKALFYLKSVCTVELTYAGGDSAVLIWKKTPKGFLSAAVHVDRRILNPLSYNNRDSTYTVNFKISFMSQACGKRPSQVLVIKDGIPTKPRKISYTRLELII